MRLWVETAIPTALILSSDMVLSPADIQGYGTTYWINENWSDLLSRSQGCNYQIKNLLADFNEKEIYIHPIKLSQWEINL